jgi:hypothetical protein
MRGTPDRRAATVVALAPRATVAPPPPAGLSASSRALWASIVASYDGWAPAEYHLLELALGAADRAAKCRRAIGRDGYEVAGKRGGQRRQHPLLRVLLHSERLTADLFRQLGLLDR